MPPATENESRRHFMPYAKNRVLNSEKTDKVFLRRELKPFFKRREEIKRQEEEKKEIRHGKLVAVATGKVLAMTQAKDEAFATCAMGDGVVIEPEKGVVVAPADGKITALMKPSLHAIGIETKEGLNLLIHIGIDTVKLDGKGFKSFVKSGQEVKAGDKLVEFDIDLIKKEGCSPDVMVVVLEDSNLPKVAYKTGEKTVAGKTVVAEF